MWRDALLDGALGAHHADADFWGAWRTDAPLELRLAWRATVVALGLFGPMLALGRFRTLSHVEAHQRDAVLQAVATSRNHWVRQSLVLLKLVSSFAAFRERDE
jgi:hypothetical protein